MEKITQTTLFEKHEVMKPSKVEQKEFVNSIMEVINSFRRPKIVMPAYTDMKIPPDVENRIFIERMILAKQRKKTATETEAMWYLSTASLDAPFNHAWYRIYMWLFQRWAKNCKKEIPDDLKEKIELEINEEHHLQRLRDWIYKTSMSALK